MILLRAERVTQDMKEEELGKVERLMEQAFPCCERVPFPWLVRKDGQVDFLAFFDGDVFCGFAWIYDQEDLSFLFYLAVEEALRGRGYGSGILKYIRDKKAGRRIVLDIEVIDEAADNIEQRKRRKSFYLRNGFRESGVHSHWHGSEFEILINDGTVTGGEIKELYSRIEKGWMR